MRAAVALTVTLALGACATLAGPRPEEVTASLDRYFTRDVAWKDWPEKLSLDDPSYKDARFTPAERCGAMGAYFLCDGRFALTNGKVRDVTLWIIRTEGQWRLMDIVPKDAEL